MFFLLFPLLLFFSFFFFVLSVLLVVVEKFNYFGGMRMRIGNSFVAWAWACAWHDADPTLIMLK